MQLQNRLAGETSPYLQQHRDNPVYWQAWNKETLRLARELDRPILLSVGYAACHWCHVMAHECFEDAEVAERMNRHFINIKVDREERPDIDQIYMAALAATGEQGGWPLTMFLTPSGEPIWGGTYFPKHSKYGRPGFLDVLSSVARAWAERRAELQAGAHAIHQHIARHLSPPEAASSDRSELKQVAAALGSLNDPVHGGLSGAPKFPNAPIQRLLWLSAINAGDRSRADQVIFGLSRMLAGGIYDHVGGGLCRYATDEAWILPHFEKMLYDNAQLVAMLSATAAYGPQASFRMRIEETIEWMDRELTTPSGAFASSLDADSEGQEGKFYLWRREEIEEILGSELALFDRHFRLVTPAGWEYDPVLVRLPQEAEADLRLMTDRLRQHRAGRVRPHRDDKVLTDWNGHAIRAIADASRQFENPAWLKLATRVYRAIEPRSDGRLPHSVNGDKALYPAFSSDYAAMIAAAIALYQAAADPAYLNDAKRYAAILEEDYGDGQGGYYLNARQADDVPLRIRGDHDEAIASASAQIIEALARLGAASGDIAFQDKAERCSRQALQRIGGRAGGHAGLIHAAHLAENPAKLVTIGAALKEVARRHPDPRRLDLSYDRGDAGAVDPLPQGIVPDPDREAAYLCPGRICLPPVHEAVDLERRIDPFRPRAPTP